MANKRLYLTINDRVRRKGECFRPSERLGNAWVLFPVLDGVAMDGDNWHLTDKRQQELRDAGLITVDEDWFSKAGRLLSVRDDDSDLTGLTDKELRDIAWKVEWCTRFNRARAGLDGHDVRPPRTPKGFDDFIERERESIHGWYRRTFKESRPLGRLINNTQKDYDYPGATTLREWLDDYEAAEHKQRAFVPNYGNCGRRNQLDERVLAIIERHVAEYGSRGLPAKVDIFDDIDGEIETLNRRLPKEGKLSVSERSVRRRINLLPPMMVDAGRLGPEEAGRKYTPVGEGLKTYEGLETIERMGRVEMDDWEMDLFAILDEPDVRKTLDANARKAAKKLRVTTRCTITAGIDVVTRCIVALNVSANPPSTMGSRRALDTMFVDKTAWAKRSMATSSWDMCAKPREVATDGGPAFTGDFRESVGRLGITHRFPGGQPGRRGHIESFFRTFKRFCRMFTGQSFANVVKRGDYDAENLASVWAHEIELLIVRFIADDYHRSPHSGLGGMTPYDAWFRSRNGLLKSPDDVQRAIAFGVRRRNLRIRAPGIRFMHVDYKHPKMGILHGLVGRRELTGVINPNDLGTILVLVPEEAKRVLSGEGDYMVFKAPKFSGVPLDRVEHYNAEILAFAAEQKAQNRSVKLEARRYLKGKAKQAREDAGVPSDVMTNEQYLEFIDRLERAGDRGTMPRPKPEGAPMTDEGEPDTLGTSIARPPGAGRLSQPGQAPLRRSINRHRGEERE
ncbi:DDE-type integrase/transposase/recombinase [Methylobacterium sp. 285MFTsu5.1]|uniref:DDE-type integrase/transposase/recombinase n=1 Tax=Methylobacterium sp. 285MFTsu5.1 TaxID=1172187 RepID=UPI000360A4A5|nr:DDE-type integrase/transposase/recombinase [Methylobacterium sp. 285MFTsu5.1]